MKSMLCAFSCFLWVFSAAAAWGQTGAAADSAAAPPDSVVVPPPAATPAPAAAATAPTQPPPAAPAATGSKSLKDRIYFGGQLTLSFGDPSSIGIAPMVGYKITPKLSAGAKIGYEYVHYDDFDQSAHNWGGSVFGRYRLVPQLYAHAEFQAINYEIFTSRTTSSRETVPFVLLGGGFMKRIAPNTWGYVEVLVDVLQDENSPYDDWDPVVTFGVGVGF